MPAGTSAAVGEMTFDGLNSYLCDAEGQLTTPRTKTCPLGQLWAVERATGGTIYQYVYDAGGARIAKGTLAAAPVGGYTGTCAPPLGSGFTLTNWCLVDLSGGQVTELTGPVGSQVWAHSNIFAGGKLTATYDANSGHGGIHIDLADPLGTKRVQVNAVGVVEETCTSLPFGNDVGNPLPASCSQPTNPPPPATADDATENHFTGKERDPESGNDYFGARYYASSMGRFMSPDWAGHPEAVPYASLTNPQSLNLYAYTGNSPLNRADADGHLYGDPVGSPSVWNGDGDPNADPSGTPSGTPEPGVPQTQPPQPPPPAQPQSCEAEMRSRPGDITAARGFGASHAWWHVVDGTGQDYTLSFTGGVTTVFVPVSTPLGTSEVPVPVPVLNSSVKAGPQSATNPNDNQQHGVQVFDQRGPTVCSGVSKMLKAARSFPQNSVPYGAQEGEATSNSGARYLGVVGGFNPSRPSQGHLDAVGWNNRIPGVE